MNVREQKILFLCPHNSARSQITEGFLQSLDQNRYEAHSAGTYPSNINPYAIKVMKVVGIDISQQHSKNVNQFAGMEFDYVFTLCDQARQVCPFFAGAKEYFHKSFEDPTQFQGSEEEILAAFRHLRDEIKDWIDKAFGEESEQTNRDV